MKKTDVGLMNAQKSPSFPSKAALKKATTIAGILISLLVVLTDTQSSPASGGDPAGLQCQRYWTLTPEAAQRAVRAATLDDASGYPARDRHVRLSPAGGSGLSD